MKRILAIVVAIVFSLLIASATRAQASTPPVQVSVEQALGLVRTLNTIQVVIATNNKRAYGTQAEMITGQMGLRPLVSGHATDKTAPEWVRQVNFSSSEILPGWVLDFALVGSGYRLILIGNRDVLITDEAGVIYRAIATKSAPKAAKLTSAKDFPGAVPHEKF
jgi:hypothetical protein